MSAHSRAPPGPSHGSGTASDVHGHCRRLILQLRQGTLELENAEGAHMPIDAALVQSLRDSLAALRASAEQLDGLWRTQISRDKSQRDMWKRKVDNVTEEVGVLTQALQKYEQRSHRRRVEEEARDELMRRGTDAAVAIDLGSSDDVSDRDKARIANSHSVLEDAMAAGRSALLAMTGQRETLKGAHKKALDVLSRLGVSESLLRVAERRARTDRVLAYGGIVSVCAVVAVVVFLYR
ncbi:golgi SNAP receptor complex member 2 [Pycnococcus provasolii]|uniref:Membrin n=1 Tax=Pycnococcus provasolii TaxID=41880 RepID=A0A6T5WBW1_9CHLO|nr:golgi SNAP receptor complex member 2 [Pycnococcus provasolii]|mmetsp:Transcript_2229/g.5044  ORF Transcript_2229/g.5044 Transcript_2229/m.5044 type:complete len:237 (+) Transcript_2229:46-756(+)|eukprot:CAMPEP_0205947650 /NCGR_PEP_ID=MMETSP1459-20131121/114_1 /ASSEMBLY_ACC=CAM_ASM_001120 /TAXON_ID=41880 /ORGANISM="Pycnococcus provasolii, Strain RCC931" /LENGTH=236 /DNA_ID=CAMNT_0053318777 /DNA_START=19 /DNA_END=729 /DNA_ORIENTATION=-